VKRLSTRHFTTLKGTGNTDITSVAVTRNSRVIAGGHQNGQIFVWNTATGERIYFHGGSARLEALLRSEFGVYVGDARERHLTGGADRA